MANLYLKIWRLIRRERNRVGRVDVSSASGFTIGGFFFKCDTLAPNIDFTVELKPYFSLSFRVERSKVRVTIIEHSKPQQISTPELNSLLQYGDKVFGETFVDTGGDGSALYTSETGDLILLGASDENSNNKMAATVTQMPPSYDRQQR